jgi:2-dehydropantoate 2-reductase
MRFCIVGAGAIGGYVGARLALAGEEVTFIARWKNLDAIQARGVRIRYPDGREEVADTVKATHDYDLAGVHDVIILAVKAHQLGPIVPFLKPLLHADTSIITMQNGIPFWYFDKLPGPHEGRAVESVDPGGTIKQAIAVERLIGCVVYPAAELAAPGVIKHIEGERFPLGELDGRITPRIQAVADAFVRGGLKAPILDNIRNEIWLKLWGNLTFNPISSLTHATLQDICESPNGHALAHRMMSEAQAVGEALGVSFRVPIDKRIEGARKVGRHKTSMLQDVEAGRDLEVDALVGAVIELGRLTGVPTPTIDAIYDATKLLNHAMRLGNMSVRGIQMPAI